MNTTLSRILGTAPVDVTKTDVYVALAAEFEAFKAEANGVVDQYAAQVSELTTALEAAGELATSLQAKLDEAQGVIVAAAEQAAAAKLAARKEKIVAAVGEAKADALMAATQNMDDTQFSEIMGALGVAADKEAKSPLFNEVGVTTQTETVPSATAESAEMKILKARHQQSA